MKNFFISYNKADRDWAEWIAWVLEAAGHTTTIQAWDFRPGGNFVVEMQKALQRTEKTVAVLSEDYLKSSFTTAEWAAVFAGDAESAKRTLVPVRVRECKPEGLLKSLIYVDLVGLTEVEAKPALLGAFEDRAKPVTPPKFPASFPGSEANKSSTLFPGALAPESNPAPVFSNPPPPSVPATLSSSERIKLNKRLNSIPPGQFNMLVSALKPAPGVVAPMPAPQVDRATQLFDWADGESGCGLRVVQEVLQQVTDPR